VGRTRITVADLQVLRRVLLLTLLYDKALLLNYDHGEVKVIGNMDGLAAFE
jgi:hypothetical protein